MLRTAVQSILVCPAVFFTPWTALTNGHLGLLMLAGIGAGCRRSDSADGASTKNHVIWSTISDIQRLNQILKNLLSNSFKFTEKGEVKLRIYRIDNKVHFDVVDNGPGIPRGAIARIFPGRPSLLHPANRGTRRGCKVEVPSAFSPTQPRWWD